MSTKDLRQFFKDFSATLEVLAREGRHVELKSRLRDYRVLLDAWLDVAPPRAERPVRFRAFALMDVFAGPVELDLRPVAEEAVKSGDTSTVVVLLDSLEDFASACLQRDQSGLSQEYLDAIVFVYYRCRGNHTMLDAVGTRLDSVLDNLLSTSAPDRFNEKIAADKGDYISVLRLSFLLVNAAIQLIQPKYARYFADRIFKAREYRASYGARRHSVLGHRPVEADWYAAIDYIAVLLIGWALEVYSHGGTKYREPAEQVFRVARTHLPSKEILIALWELFHTESMREASLEAQLGVSNWDVRDWDTEVRTGIVTTRWGGGEWVRNGLLGCLLIAKSERGVPLSNICLATPNRFMWDTNRERAALQAIVVHPLLNIPEQHRDSAVEKSVSLIAERAQGSTAHYLRYVLDSKLSVERIAKLKREALDAWVKHRSWIDAVRELGVSSSEVSEYPQDVQWGIWLARESLLDDNNWASGFGQILGEGCGIRESASLIHALEQSADDGPRVDALATLPEIVRRGIRELRQRGYEANALIIPSDDRFTGALFRKPVWEVEGNRQYGDASVGDWEGLHVMRYPYSRAKAILLISTSSLLAARRMSESEQVFIDVDDSPHDRQASESRTIARSALDQGESTLPESSSIITLVRMTISPEIGISDKRAMLKLSLEDSDGGYAILPDSEFYHRPSCSEIQHLSPEYVLSIPRERSLKPCPKCRPELWNQEGRRGLVDGEPDEESDEDALRDVK